MNADLHLGDEAIDLRIGSGARIGLNDPTGRSPLLDEFDGCQRRCERVIQLGKSHRPAKVGAAKNGEPVHAISGDMDRGPDTIRQMRVAREPDCVLAGRHQFGERNPRLRRVYPVHGQVDVSQYFAGRITLIDEDIE